MQHWRSGFTVVLNRELCLLSFFCLVRLAKDLRLEQTVSDVTQIEERIGALVVTDVCGEFFLCRVVAPQHGLFVAVEREVANIDGLACIDTEAAVGFAAWQQRWLRSAIK